MMKRALLLLALTIAVVLPTYGQSKRDAGEKSQQQPSTGQGSTPELADIQAFVGTWKENLGKSQRRIASNLTMTYTANSDGSITQARGGGGAAYDLTFRIDGKEYPVGDRPGRTVAMRQIDGNTWESVNRQDGKEVSRTRMVISADGQTRTVTTTRQTNEGASKTESVYRRAAGSGHSLIGKWEPVSVKSNTPEIIKFDISSAGEVSYHSLPFQQTYTAKLGGPESPSTGPGILSNVTVSLRQVGPRKLEQTDRRNGQVIFVTMWTVSADGETLTSASKAPNTNDKPSLGVYEKQ